jgi:hypothetical protein
MSDLTLRSRRAAIEGLQRLSDELAQASTWLDGFEDDQEASKACLLLEEAWKCTAAAAWSLSRAVRVRPGGWLAADGQQRPQQG